VPGYLVAEVDITDAEAYEVYKRIVPESVAAHGGRFLVRGGAVVPKEGGWDPKRLVVIEFASLAAAQKFYDSPEYARALAIRLKATNSRLVLVEGA
jgi:uncharacterized protein (DUF1330 family)